MKARRNCNSSSEREYTQTNFWAFGVCLVMWQRVRLQQILGFAQPHLIREWYDIIVGKLLIVPAIVLHGTIKLYPKNSDSDSFVFSACNPTYVLKHAIISIEIVQKTEQPCIYLYYVVSVFPILYMFWNYSESDKKPPGVMVLKMPCTMICQNIKAGQFYSHPALLLDLILYCTILLYFKSQL